MRDHVLRRRLRSPVIVTLKTGTTFAGVLWENDRRTLVLRNAKHVSGTAEAVPADGELLLEWADVEYVQRPGPVEV